MKRRRWLATAPALAAAAALPGCDAPWSQPAGVGGGFSGSAPERGHRLRDAAPLLPPARTRRTRVLIAGAGVAGLAAARALRLRGEDDFCVLELEDSAGGNSRAGQLGGLACPLGAHYLPVPGDDAPEVQHLLEELGLRQRQAGRWVYDERHLCHSPQERLFLHGHWQDGLLPREGVGPATLAQYRRFAAAVRQAQRAGRFQMPTANVPPALAHRALDAMTFEAWLNQEGLDDAHLRWYLGYCCRDDYGAGPATVSAWAGLHYFASRHGFQAPGEAEPGRDGGVLTWPEGNAWLTRRLAAPLGERLRTGQLVHRIAAGRHAMEVDVLDGASGQLERWQAERVVLALPLFVAARVLENPPEALRQAAAGLPHAPWLVANLLLRAPLHDRPGAAPSWDNVFYASPGLGYVDAGHQRLSPGPGPTVLTHYRALGDRPDGRRWLLERPWSAWRDELLAEFHAAHPDLPDKLQRLELTRHGHAMAIPVPGVRHSAALAALRQGLPAPWQRLRFAHSDLAGYSVFEEAFTLGHRAGRA